MQQEEKGKEEVEGKKRKKIRMIRSSACTVRSVRAVCTVCAAHFYLEEDKEKRMCVLCIRS